MDGIWDWNKRMSREHWLAEVDHGNARRRLHRAAPSDPACFRGLIVGVPLSLMFWAGIFAVADLWL